MRAFAEKALVMVVALIFLSVAFTLRHAFFLAPPEATRPAAGIDVLEVPQNREVIFVREHSKRWWSTPAPPAEPIIAPVPPPPPSASDLASKPGHTLHLADPDFRDL